MVLVLLVLLHGFLIDVTNFSGKQLSCKSGCGGYILFFAEPYHKLLSFCFMCTTVSLVPELLVQALSVCLQQAPEGPLQ